MINLFNRQKYSDLVPGERIEKLVREYLQPDLVKLDFKPLKSELTFKRTKNDFVQEIHVTKSRMNYGKVNVNFWLIFSVRSHKYAKWHKRQYGYDPMNDFIISNYDSHFKSWKSKYRSTQYDLAKFDNIHLMKDIRSKMLRIGIPILDEVSDWERAADYMVAREQFGYISKIFDFYVIADKIKEAKNSLTLAETCFSKIENVPEERFDEIKIRKNIFKEDLR